MNPIYGELREATPEELLAAVKMQYEEGTYVGADFFSGLELGFRLASPGGWEHCAPAWLQKMREKRE